MNSEVFVVNPLAKYCFYFDPLQNDFSRPDYTNALQIERSLETEATWNIINNVKKILLEEFKVSGNQKIEAEVNEKTKKNVRNAKDESKWLEIAENKQQIAEHLMRTIYIASGLEPSDKKDPWPQDENHIVIKNVLDVAKKHNIPLNFEYIPRMVRQEEKKTALMVAVDKGDLAAAKVLIEAKANIEANNKYEKNALIMASINGNVSMVNLLIEQKAQLKPTNKYDYTPLWSAASNGQAHVIKTLIEARADFDSPDQDGVTPAFEAVSQGHVNVIQVLLEAKIDIDKPDEEKNTLIHIATKNSEIAMIKALAEAKANLDQADKKGLTPACIAASRKNFQAIQVLSECKANLNQADLAGKTPLHWAIQKNHLETVKALIDCGVDLSSGNKVPFDFVNEEMKVFVALQMLKKFIKQSYISDEKQLGFISNQLSRIQVAESKTKAKWSQVMEDVFSIANSQKEIGDSLTFFQDKSIKNNLNMQAYLQWFSSSSPEKLMENISKASSENTLSTQLKSELG